jgi:hypothetical protein
VVKYTELDSDTKKNLFRDFKINYNKAYKDSKEESFRMQQFDSFLERVDKINAMQIATGGEGVVHGVTKFADYTQDEFAKMFMGFVPADAETKKTRMEKQKAITVHPTSSSKTSVDWTGVYTTSVNDQDLRDKAYMQFPEEQYKHYSPRCIFLEHTVPASAVFP